LLVLRSTLAYANIAKLRKAPRVVATPRRFVDNQKRPAEDETSITSKEVKVIL